MLKRIRDFFAPNPTPTPPVPERELSPQVREGIAIWKQLVIANNTGTVIADERLEGRAWRMLYDHGSFLVARFEHLPLQAWHVLLPQPDPLGDAPGDESCPASWKKDRTVVFAYIVMPDGRTTDVPVNRPGKWRQALSEAEARTEAKWRAERDEYTKRERVAYTPVDEF